MPFVIIIIIIVFVLSSASNSEKKKQAEFERREAERRRKAINEVDAEKRENQEVQQRGVPTPNVAPSLKPRVSQSSGESTIRNTKPDLVYDKKPEGAPNTIYRTIKTSSVNKPGHVVEPSMKSGHAHMETSMTGIEDCGEARASENNVIVIGQIGTELPRFDSKAAIVYGIICSEILAKPKALRR